MRHISSPFAFAYFTILLISDPNERAHFWLPDSEATTSHELLESPASDRMYIDQGEIVRVRVEADEFYDDEPGPPKAAEGVVIKREARRPPYTIIVSLKNEQVENADGVV